MSLSAIMQGVYGAEVPPSWAQLEWRQAVVNGAGPNVVLDGLAANDRPLGALPQRSLTVAAAADAGGVLAASTAYTYGVQRVVKCGALVIPSAVTIAGLTPTELSNGTVTLTEYEYAPETGALWTVVYRVYRSKAGAPTLLYLVEELDAADFAALTAGEYTDDTADANLNAALTHSTAVADANGWVPPCRFVRAWRGRFVLAGALERQIAGGVTVEAGDLDEVLCPAGWTVQPSDIGAQLRIAGLAWVHTVAEVDAAANSYRLVSAAAVAVADAEAWLFRPDARVYVTNPQPGNVEGYTLGTEVQRNDGAGEQITGLAVRGGYAYVLHTRGLLLLDASGGEVSVVPFPGGAPGCVSQGTVADGSDAPALFYYAGAAGVIEIAGTAARNIGLKIEGTLRERVDHGLDGWSHGVYDAGRGWYWLWLFEKGGPHAAGLRIPQLCLVWDTAAEAWYELELAAQSSAVWRSAAGGAVVVVGLPEGLAVLADEAAGDVEEVEGTVGAADVFGSDSWSLSAASLPEAGLTGLPLHFESPAGTVYRYLVKSGGGAAVTVAGAFDPVPQAGWLWRLGSVRFAAETGILAADVPESDRVERVLLLHEPADQGLAVTLRGVRGRAAETVRVEHSMAAAGEVDLQGPQLGLRGRGFRLELDGDGFVPIRLQQVLLETSEVVRHER